MTLNWSGSYTAQRTSVGSSRDHSLGSSSEQEIDESDPAWQVALDVLRARRMLSQRDGSIPGEPMPSRDPTPNGASSASLQSESDLDKLLTRFGPTPTRPAQMSSVATEQQQKLDLLKTLKSLSEQLTQGQDGRAAGGAVQVTVSPVVGAPAAPVSGVIGPGVESAQSLPGLVAKLQSALNARQSTGTTGAGGTGQPGQVRGAGQGAQVAAAKAQDAGGASDLDIVIKSELARTLELLEKSKTDKPKRQRRRLLPNVLSWPSFLSFKDQNAPEAPPSNMLGPKILRSLRENGQYIYEMLDDAYEETEEGKYVMDGFAFLWMTMWCSIIMVVCFAVWFGFLQNYCQLELAKMITLVGMMCFMMSRRTPLMGCMFLGIGLSSLMTIYQHDVYVEIKPDQLNNCRVYQPLDRCMRKKDFTIMTGNYLLGNVLKYCTGGNANAYGLRCQSALQYAVKSRDQFEDCVREIIANPKIVERQSVYTVYYTPSNTESYEEFKFDDALNRNNVRALYGLLAYRIDLGNWWEDHERTENLMKLYEVDGGSAWMNFLDKFRPILPLLFPNQAPMLAAMGLMKDTGNLFMGAFTPKVSVVDLVAKNFKGEMLDGYAKIEKRQVMISAIDFPSAYTRLPFQVNEIVRHPNFTKFAVEFHSASENKKVNLGQLQQPREGTLPISSASPIYQGTSCPTVTEIRAYPWNPEKCPLFFETAQAVLEALYNDKDPMFCPKYCHNKVFMTPVESYAETLLRELGDCYSEKNSLSSQSEKMMHEYHENVNKVKQEYLYNLSLVSEEMSRKTCPGPGTRFTPRMNPHREQYRGVPNNEGQNTPLNDNVNSGYTQNPVQDQSSNDNGHSQNHDRRNGISMFESIQSSIEQIQRGMQQVKEMKDNMTNTARNVMNIGYDYMYWISGGLFLIWFASIYVTWKLSTTRENTAPAKKDDRMPLPGGGNKRKSQSAPKGPGGKADDSDSRSVASSMLEFMNLWHVEEKQDWREFLNEKGDAQDRTLTWIRTEGAQAKAEGKRVRYDLRSCRWTVF